MESNIQQDLTRGRPIVFTGPGRGLAAEIVARSMASMFPGGNCYVLDFRLIAPSKRIFEHPIAVSKAEALSLEITPDIWTLGYVLQAIERQGANIPSALVIEHMDAWAGNDPESLDARNRMGEHLLQMRNVRRIHSLESYSPEMNFLDHRIVDIPEPVPNPTPQETFLAEFQTQNRDLRKAVIRSVVASPEPNAFVPRGNQAREDAVLLERTGWIRPLERGYGFSNEAAWAVLRAPLRLHSIDPSG